LVVAEELPMIAPVARVCSMASFVVLVACGGNEGVRDKDNYLFTRANALEGKVRFYVAGAWHTLAASAQGDAITISWDGEKLLDAQEATQKSGSVGVWTKADSITAFDDLKVSGR
jgi:hypothetical protein